MKHINTYKIFENQDDIKMVILEITSHISDMGFMVNIQDSFVKNNYNPLTDGISYAMATNFAPKKAYDIEIYSNHMDSNNMRLFSDLTTELVEVKERLDSMGSTHILWTFQPADGRKRIETELSVSILFIPKDK